MWTIADVHLPLYLLHVDYMIWLPYITYIYIYYISHVSRYLVGHMDVVTGCGWFPRNASLTKHSSRQGVIQLGPPLKDRDRKRKSTSRGAGAWFSCGLILCKKVILVTMYLDIIDIMCWGATQLPPVNIATPRNWNGFRSIENGLTSPCTYVLLLDAISEGLADLGLYCFCVLTEQHICGLSIS